MKTKQVKVVRGWNKITHPTVWFVRLALLYAACTIIANVIAIKIFTVAPGIYMTAGVIIFPIVYIISDIMTEVYGMRLSLVAIRMNVVLNILLVVLTYIAMKLPAAPFWTGQNAFNTMFMWTWRIVLASIAGYYFGDWSNSTVLSRMKIHQKGRNFAWRALFSTVVGEGVDTTLFVVIAFFGLMPTKNVIMMLVSIYVFKIAYEAVCLPFTVQVVKWWKKLEGMEVYDDTDNVVSTYNPF